MLRDLLQPAALRRLAGGRAHERGAAYAVEGRVSIVDSTADHIVAIVQGERCYEVELQATSAGIAHSCSCPMGDRGNFCKHCVAVGLVATSEPSSLAPSIDEIVAGLDRAALAAIVRDQARRDPSLFHRLRVQVAAGGDLDVHGLRRMIDHAFETGGFVSYNEMPRWAEAPRDAIAMLAEALDRGLAAAVVELSEYALAAWEEALERLDDSDGFMSDLLDDLACLHLAACRRAHPDGSELAERLFNTAMKSGYGVFLYAAETHAGVLGDSGLAAYRRLATAAWDELPTLSPGDDRDHAGRRFALARILEQLAAGDVDETVAVKAKDLSQPSTFVEIAEHLRSVGRVEEAREWAERGIVAFPTSRDLRLRDVATEIAQEQGNLERAVEIRLDGFTANPGLRTYQRLAEAAMRRGAWDEMRPTALERMEAVITPELSRRRFTPIGGTELVHALIWEGDLDASLSVAGRYGCAPGTWLALADALAPDSPQEAIAIYRAQLDPTIQGKTKQAYSAAVELLGKILECHRALGDDDGFPAVVAEVRANHRPKRNLMALLDAAGW